jgi:hypothetical protein
VSRNYRDSEVTREPDAGGIGVKAPVGTGVAGAGSRDPLDGIGNSFSGPAGGETLPPSAGNDVNGPLRYAGIAPVTGVV